MASRTRSPSLNGRKSSQRPEPRLVPHVEQRHYLYARQVGVSVVCGMGSRLSHACALNGRFRLRKGADAVDVAHALFAPQRAASRLRVELQRRESSGTCLGNIVPF